VREGRCGDDRASAATPGFYTGGHRSTREIPSRVVSLASDAAFEISLFGSTRASLARSLASARPGRVPAPFDGHTACKILVELAGSEATMKRLSMFAVLLSLVAMSACRGNPNNGTDTNNSRNTGSSSSGTTGGSAGGSTTGSAGTNGGTASGR
jgi:hypothetical protein